MEPRFFIFYMRKIIFPIIALVSLVTGITSGIAYERYYHREECLKETFIQTPSDLSPEEIENITKALNVESEDSNDLSSDASQNNINSNKPVPGKFVGSRNSNKFYAVGCRYTKLIKEENKVFFESVEEGEKTGRKYVEC